MIRICPSYAIPEKENDIKNNTRKLVWVIFSIPVSYSNELQVTTPASILFSFATCNFHNHRENGVIFRDTSQ